MYSKVFNLRDRLLLDLRDRLLLDLRDRLAIDMVYTLPASA